MCLNSTLLDVSVTHLVLLLVQSLFRIDSAPQASISALAMSMNTDATVAIMWLTMMLTALCSQQHDAIDRSTA